VNGNGRKKFGAVASFNHTAIKMVTDVDEGEVCTVGVYIPLLSMSPAAEYDEHALLEAKLGAVQQPPRSDEIVGLGTPAPR